MGAPRAPYYAPLRTPLGRSASPTIHPGGQLPFPDRNPAEAQRDRLGLSRWNFHQRKGIPQFDPSDLRAFQTYLAHQDCDKISNRGVVLLSGADPKLGNRRHATAWRRWRYGPRLNARLGGAVRG